MEINVGAKFILKKPDGLSYEIIVFNITESRSPSSKYGASIKVVGSDSEVADLFFFGNEFFKSNITDIHLVRSGW